MAAGPEREAPIIQTWFGWGSTGRGRAIAEPSTGTALYLLADRLERIEGQLGRLLEDRSNVTEMWVTKKDLAKELGASPRWINDRMAEGLPHRVIAGKALYRLSAVEGWLKEHSYLREVS